MAPDRAAPVGARPPRRSTPPSRAGPGSTQSPPRGVEGGGTEAALEAALTAVASSDVKRARKLRAANRAVAAPASALPMSAREQTSAIFLEAPPSPRLHQRAPQQCAVCLRPVGDSHPYKGPRTKLSGCGHVFCKECITPALAPPNPARCPTCRADVAWIEFSSGHQRVAPRELPVVGAAADADAGDADDRQRRVRSRRGGGRQEEEDQRRRREVQLAAVAQQQ